MEVRASPCDLTKGTFSWLQLLTCFVCVCVCVVSHAEQLVLYLKSAELLSAALQTAMHRVQQGALYPSSTVKQGN